MRSASTRERPDDPILAPSPGADAQHFAALCRGMIVLVGLSLPIGLTLAFAAPPNGGDDGHAPVLTATGSITPAPRPPRSPRVVGVPGIPGIMG